MEVNGETSIKYSFVSYSNEKGVIDFMAQNRSSSRVSKPLRSLETSFSDRCIDPLHDKRILSCQLWLHIFLGYFAKF